MTNVCLLPASFVTSLRPTRSSVHKPQHKKNHRVAGDVITTMAHQRNNSLRLISTRKISPETPNKTATSLLNHQQSRTITAGALCSHHLTLLQLPGGTGSSHVFQGRRSCCLLRWHVLQCRCRVLRETAREPGEQPRQSPTAQEACSGDYESGSLLCLTREKNTTKKDAKKGNPLLRAAQE
ncbi:unnamed protein product [Ectocarpus sp. 12 AP-2014]